MLKTPEKRPPKNALICRQFTILRMPLKSITRPLQGGGRWFEPSIAHFQNSCERAIYVGRERAGILFPPLLLQPERGPILQLGWVRRGGRSKQRPEELVADRAHAGKFFDQWLRSNGIKPTITSYARRARKHPKRWRPVKAGSNCAERWKVERAFVWRGNFRRLLVRQERYLSASRGYFLVAFVLVLLRYL
jgi:transposase